ncbi:Mediator of DNA damage checkpoint protein 1 [Thoreauomyces humboldtii]|nr:Mediator of DNA damage checkpoint protein 1 [Thoreauomyces humboldtii]
MSGELGPLESPRATSRDDDDTDDTATDADDTVGSPPYHRRTSSLEEKAARDRDSYREKRNTEDVDPIERRWVGKLRLLETHGSGPEGDDVLLNIRTGLNLIGTDEDCAIVLTVQGVSGFHGIIDVSENENHLEYFLEDLKSTNGTFMGEHRLKLKPYRLYQLVPNQVITIGAVRCRFEPFEIEPTEDVAVGDEPSPGDTPHSHTRNSHTPSQRLSLNSMPATERMSLSIAPTQCNPSTVLPTLEVESEFPPLMHETKNTPMQLPQHQGTAIGDSEPEDDLDPDPQSNHPAGRSGLVSESAADLPRIMAEINSQNSWAASPQLLPATSSPLRGQDDGDETELEDEAVDSKSVTNVGLPAPSHVTEEPSLHGSASLGPDTVLVEETPPRQREEVVRSPPGTREPSPSPAFRSSTREPEVHHMDTDPELADEPKDGIAEQQESVESNRQTASTLPEFASDTSVDEAPPASVSVPPTRDDSQRKDDSATAISILMEPDAIGQMAEAIEEPEMAPQSSNEKTTGHGGFDESTAASAPDQKIVDVPSTTVSDQGTDAMLLDNHTIDTGVPSNETASNSGDMDLDVPASTSAEQSEKSEAVSEAAVEDSLPAKPATRKKKLPANPRKSRAAAKSKIKLPDPVEAAPGPDSDATDVPSSMQDVVPVLKRAGKRSRESSRAASVAIDHHGESSAGPTPPTSHDDELVDEGSLASISGSQRSRRSESAAPQSPAVKDRPISVLFTGIADSDERGKAVEALGGNTADDWQHCTHLVTDRIRRTVKFLCALSAGKHIVSLKWLDASKKAGKFVSETKHLLKDAKSEKQFGCNLATSMAKASGMDDTGVFDGLRFYSTSSVKPPPMELAEILSAAGAEHLSKLPTDHDSNLIVVGNAEDTADLKRVRAAGYSTIHTVEFVLTGLLRMEVDRSSHLLAEDEVPPPRKKRR